MKIVKFQRCHHLLYTTTGSVFLFSLQPAFVHPCLDDEADKGMFVFPILCSLFDSFTFAWFAASAHFKRLNFSHILRARRFCAFVFTVLTPDCIVVFLPDSEGCIQKRAPQLCSRSTASLLMAKKLIPDYSCVNKVIFVTIIILQMY